MYNTLTEDRGQNLFQTSTHTAHHWRDGYYFPSSNFQPVKYDPIPPSLNVRNEVLPQTHYITTTNTYHDDKYPYQDLYNDPVGLRNTKPMANYRVNYLSDVVEKLNAKPRRPLTMAFQKTEYKSEFDDKDPEVTYQFDRPISSGPHNYLIKDELTSGPTKTAFDGTIKPVVPARKFDPNEQGVFHLLDPYLTTYNKEHKKWKPSEWHGIAKKDAATIYDTEKYPKSSLGFGTKENPVPLPHIVQNKEPMRDEIWFKSETKQRQIHQPAKLVQYRGLVTENQENYKAPSDVKYRESKICPIDSPFTLSDSGSKTIFATSGMYNTEYTNIGRGKPVTIPDMKEKNY